MARRRPRSGAIDSALALLHGAIGAPHRAELVAEELRGVLSRIWIYRHRVYLEAVMHDILTSASSPSDLDRIRWSLEAWQDRNGYRPR